MRILTIPHAYAPVLGGAEFQCRRVAEILAEQGQVVRVLTADVGSVESYYRLGIAPIGCKDEVINGVEVVRIEFYPRILSYMWQLFGSQLSGSVKSRISNYILKFSRLRFRRRLEIQIDIFKPDVVVVLPHLVENVLAVLDIQRRRQFPLVMVPLLHEEDPNWSISSMRKALAQASAVVANTEHERRRLVEAYAVDERRVFVGGNAVDVYSETRSSEIGDKILFLGRKVPGKGVIDLIEAMKIVWVTHSEASLIIAGARSIETNFVDQALESLPNKFQNLVKSYDNVSEEEKNLLFSQARCLVLPSSKESFGIVLLEAWSRGIPVITLDLPVFRELVTIGDDGLLVPPNDLYKLAESICWILDNPEKARCMGEAGFKKVRSSFSWEEVAAQYLKAYQCAIGM